MKAYIPQVNNFVVFNKFWESGPPAHPSDTSNTLSYADARSAHNSVRNQKQGSWQSVSQRPLSGQARRTCRHISNDLLNSNSSSSTSCSVGPGPSYGRRANSIGKTVDHGQYRATSSTHFRHDTISKSIYQPVQATRVPSFGRRSKPSTSIDPAHENVFGFANSSSTYQQQQQSQQHHPLQPSWRKRNDSRQQQDESHRPQIGIRFAANDKEVLGPRFSTDNANTDELHNARNGTTIHSYKMAEPGFNAFKSEGVRATATATKAEERANTFAQEYLKRLHNKNAPHTTSSNTPYQNTSNRSHFQDVENTAFQKSRFHSMPTYSRGLGVMSTRPW